MTETIRCWLVEREYDDRGLLRLVYATPDGSRHLRRERSAALVDEVTAATDTSEERLRPVDEEELRERYAAEVDRVRARHGPDEAI
ncbi:hypothetical protein [Natronorarus salvus]|uniref:hypothetical protein n=1 Tax=Natronorarus salvus TaxID=3117733 RepID=UPI002F26C64D